VHFYINQEPFCDIEEALVSGKNPIPDAKMTANSEFDDLHGPRFARINNTDSYGGWRSTFEDEIAPKPRMYIQVR